MASIIPRAPLPQTQLQGLPQVRVQQGPDQSALIRGAEAVNEAGQQILKVAQDRNDTTALLQARRELSDWEAKTFNPGNPDGIAKYRGQNALKADELVPQVDEQISTIRGRLSPKQQAAFDGISGNFREGLQGRLNSYMDREHETFLQAEQKASIDNMGQDAITAGVGGDFSRQDQLANELIAMNRARLEADGAGEETIKASTRDVVSTVRMQTINGMMASRPFEAQDYYNRYADQMTPLDRAKVDAVLAPIVNDAEDDAVADAIIAGRDVGVSPDVDASLDGIDAQISRLEGTGQNPRSSARGVGQFIDSTWLSTLRKHRPDLAEGKSNAEIIALKDDPKIAGEMLGKFREDNARGLAARGISTTPENLYAAHHFGVGGAAKFANASASTPMSQILSRKEIDANPYLKGKTVGEVKANWAQRGLRAAGASEGPAPGGIPRTEADAVAAAQSIADPRRRKAIVSKIREKWSIRDSQRQEQEKLLSEHIYTSISQNTDPRKPLREIIGPDAFALAERKGQIPSLESQRKAAILGTLVQDDLVLADALYREAVLSPNTFKKRNLYDQSGKLSTDTLQNLLKMQADVDKPDKRTEWATTEQRIQNGYLTLGISTSGDKAGGKNEARQEQRAAFAAMYRAAETAFIQRQKREPTQAEADTLLRATTKNAAQLQADERLTLARGGAVVGFGIALPEADRAEIVANFREDVGRDPTDAEIVNIAAKFRTRNQ